MLRGSFGLGPRISGLFACHFIGFGFYLPFFPLVLKARGVDPAMIGYILGGTTLLRIIASPVLSGLSDRSGRRRRSIFLYSLIAAGGVLLFLATERLEVMIAGIALLTIFQAPIVPLSDAYAMSAVRSHGLDYGRMRLWGSVAFIVSNLIGGPIVQLARGTFIGLGVLAGLVATGLMAIALPQAAPAADKAGERAGATADTRPTAETGERAPSILLQPAFLVALVCLGLIEGSHAAYYGYSSLFFRSSGIPDTFVGVLWSVGVAVEIGVFIVIGRVSGRLSPLALVQFGAVAAVLRWTLFPLSGGNLAFMLPLQALHGLTFAVTHVGAVRFIAAMVPERWAATGQGVLASSSGVLMAVGMAISGPLYELSPAYPFWIMACCAGAGSVGLAALGLLRARSVRAG
ncbi:MFS transporter [Roseibium aestuarii]|uniref:MFS transporter n=1 Tax=Roseibium aestuarii TaxID=2600299 RepID=A0ABW4JZN1_9HYPH|nr:MFS transporter [Roseibium aestuarii]